MFQAQIFVTLKPTVNDPQGLTVMASLHRLGFNNADDVRVGKYLLVDVNEADRAEAEHSVTHMCEQLLANPVIEDFRFDLVEIPNATGTS